MDIKIKQKPLYIDGRKMVKSSDMEKSDALLYKEMVKKIGSTGSLKNLPVENFDDISEKSDLPMRDEVVINVHYTSDSKFLDDFGANSDVSGCFVIRDENRYFGDDEYPDGYHCVVLLDEDRMRSMVESEYQMDREHGLLTAKEDHVIDYVTSLTHEIFHAVEFAQNTQGMTPKEAFESHQAKQFPYDMEQCSTGYGMARYIKDYQKVDELDLEGDLDVFERMEMVSGITEGRVEMKGRELAEALPIDYLKSYESAPKRKKSNDLSI